MAHAVFISHSPKDQWAADEICASLEKAGIRCWMASRSVLSGSELSDAIVNMIRSSRLMVVVLSHDSNKSDQVLYELELASTSLVPILPFPIDSVMPGGRMKRYVGSSTSMYVYIYPMGYRINQLRKVVSHILKTRPRPPAEPSGYMPAAPPAPSPAAKKSAIPEWFWVLAGIAVTGICILLSLQ